MYDLIPICRDLKSKVSEKRYNHCINVGNMAKKLARIYGVDERKAYIAGILHDIAKEMSYTEQLEIVEGIGFFPAEYSRKNYRYVKYIAINLHFMKKYDMNFFISSFFHSTRDKITYKVSFNSVDPCGWVFLHYFKKTK